MNQKTTIQEIKLSPLKLLLYFTMSVRELDGPAPSIGSTFTEEQDVTFFFMWHHLPSKIIVIGQRFSFAKNSLQKWKRICRFFSSSVNGSINFNSLRWAHSLLVVWGPWVCRFLLTLKRCSMLLNLSHLFFFCCIHKSTISIHVTCLVLVPSHGWSHQSAVVWRAGSHFKPIQLLLFFLEQQIISLP